MKASEVSKFCDRFSRKLFRRIHKAGYRISVKSKELTPWQEYVQSKCKKFKGTGKLKNKHAFSQLLKKLGQKWQAMKTQEDDRKSKYSKKSLKKYKKNSRDY
jgi:phage antirepressor YoqD-like protein